MVELFRDASPKQDGSGLQVSYGFFTEDNIYKAIADLRKEYPDSRIYYNSVELNVLKMYKDKVIDYNDHCKHICKHCENGVCMLSPEDGEDAACNGSLSEMEECAYIDGYGIENMTLDAKVEQIRKDAEEIEKILSECKTLGDIRNLTHVSGVHTDGCTVCIGESWVNAFNSEFSDDLIPEAVSLKAHNEFLLEHPTYNFTNRSLTFDIYDPTYDDDYAVLEDCTLADFENVYREFVKEQEALL